MVLRPRNGLSLCAGGGGLDLGLMLAEPGFHTRCWVEWEEYPRSVIVAAQRAGYFAPAPIWDDLTTFDARPFAGCIDTLLAGYPCQPFSHAGQRKGADDERHLWPDVARVARELGPSLKWVFLENVAGHVSLGLETVLRELWDMGFTPAVGLFTAAETGAPHERERVFIVAHRQSIGAGEQNDEIGSFARGDAWRGLSRSSRGFHGDVEDSISSGAGSVRAEADQQGRHPVDRREDGIRCRDGAARPDRSSSNGAELEHATGLDRRIHARSRREGGRTADAGGTGAAMADTGGARLEGRERSGASDKWLWSSPSGSTAERGRPLLHPPGPADTGRWADVLVTSPDLAPSASFGDLASFAGQVAAMAQAGLVAEAEIEPALRRMADGLALRSRALRLLGNGVHPLAAGHAWRTLSAAHGLRPLDLVAARDGDSGGADEFDMRAAE